jgi:Protein of unknown function (DUF1553)
MLSAAGKLNLTPPPASPAKDFKVIELRNNGPEAKNLMDKAVASTQRSVYLPLLRGITPNSLAVFDFAEQGFVTGSRDSTTVAPQALYLLNDPFVRKQSLALAERLLAKSDLDDIGQTKLAYRLIFSREPTTHELERGSAFLVAYEGAFKEELIAKGAAKPQAASEGAPGETTAEGATDANKPKPPPNPDDIDRSEGDVKEEKIEAKDPKAAAWASFCQALLGTAEFRYLK